MTVVPDARRDQMNDSCSLGGKYSRTVRHRRHIAAVKPSARLVPTLKLSPIGWAKYYQRGKSHRLRLREKRAGGIVKVVMHRERHTPFFLQ